MIEQIGTHTYQVVTAAGGTKNRWPRRTKATGNGRWSGARLQQKAEKRKRLRNLSLSEAVAKLMRLREGKRGS